MPSRYELGNAEIEELYVIVRRHHDVSGLEVTVNDAAAVRARKRIRNLYAVAECTAQVQAVARDHFGQRPAGHVLHRDEARAILGIYPVDRGNVGMVQRRGRLCFLLESAQPSGVRCKFLWKDLDGDIPLQPHVARFVDHPHTALAEEAFDLVGTQTGAGLKAHALRIILVAATAARSSNHSSSCFFPRRLALQLERPTRSVRRASCVVQRRSVD